MNIRISKYNRYKEIEIYIGKKVRGQINEQAVTKIEKSEMETHVDGTDKLTNKYVNR